MTSLLHLHVSLAPLVGLKEGGSPVTFHGHVSHDAMGIRSGVDTRTQVLRGPKSPTKPIIVAL